MLSPLSRTMNEEVLIKVEQVSKKFCLSLRRSLFYGLQDIGREMLCLPQQKHLRLKEFWALEDISFELRRGECLGLIGRNGAGKSTLLKLLNGLIKPDTGRIEINGQVGGLIALGAGFNPILTGRENVYINGAILGLKQKEINNQFDKIVSFAEVEDFIDTPVQNYSSGMQVRLGFAVAAMLLKPDILILDEVLAVGDARFQSKCINVIKRMATDGTAIILVSHNMHNILRYCSVGLYLENGTVAGQGPIANVSNAYMMRSHEQLQVNAEAVPETDENVTTTPGFHVGEIFALDNLGQKTKILEFGQRILFFFPLSYQERPNSKVVLELAINDSSGLLLHSISQVLNLPETSPQDCLEIKIEIQHLPLTSTQLNVGAAIWSPDQNILYGWSKDNLFSVHNPVASPGRLDLPIQFSTVQRKVGADDPIHQQLTSEQTSSYH